MTTFLNAADYLEEAIQAAIDVLAGRCTILVIAHRFATLRRADRVIVLQGGRVVEQGSPELLLSTEGSATRGLALE